MKTAVGLIFLLALSACGGGGNPPQPPEPPPPPWQCELQMPECGEVNQQCSTPESPCWHNPTQDPEHCEEAPQCPGPPEPPEPPQPTDCQPPDSADPNWGDPIDPSQRAFDPLIRKAILACMDQLGNACERPWLQSLEELGACLRQRGYRAGKWADSVLVLIPGTDNPRNRAEGGFWEEWHAVFSGNGCWITGVGGFKGTWPYDAPLPPCGPAGDCPEPHPDMSRMKFNCGEHQGVLDCTLTTVDQWDFCGSIGYCCMPSSPTNDCNDPACVRRGGCPVRGDGHPDRAICEAELCDEQWMCNGQPEEGWNGNPAQSNCQGHWKTWCANAPNVVAEGDR